MTCVLTLCSRAGGYNPRGECCRFFRKSARYRNLRDQHNVSEGPAASIFVAEGRPRWRQCLGEILVSTC